LFHQFRNDVILSVLGSGGLKILELRDKSNEELLKLYDPEIILHCTSPRNRNDTRRMLRRFLIEFLMGKKPSAPLAKEFLSRFSNLKPRTIYRYASMISPFMKWYGEPIADVRIKVPKSLPPFTEDDEVDKLLDAMRNKKSHKKIIRRDVLLVETDRKTGMRRSELANLEAGDIHGDFLIVRGGKGQKDRTIPLVPSLAKDLNRFTAGMAPTQKVFGLKAASIGNKIQLFAKKAGVQIHTHTLRHKFATDLIDRGANPRAVQQLMGHENLATTDVYVGMRDSALRDAVNLLEGPSRAAKSVPVADTQVFETSLTMEAGPDARNLFQSVLTGFYLELPAPKVLIESLQVRTSDPSLPFRLLVLEHQPQKDKDASREDVVRMEIGEQRTVTWPAATPFLYSNANGQNKLYGAIEIGYGRWWVVTKKTKKWDEWTLDVSKMGYPPIL
jgi:integrase/recombinase XerD